MKTKAIIFDFDGVIVDSVGIKADAFVELFKEYPVHIKAIREYHFANGGISRFEKFRHIYKNILRQRLTENEERQLSRAFSNLVVDRVINSPYMPGAEEALKYCSSRGKLFIVSGTPESEIRMIVRRRKLENFFCGVFGAPVGKSEHIRRIMRKHSLLSDDAVIIGDSLEDYKAAEECDIRFIGFVRPKSENVFASIHLEHLVQDMYGLMGIIE